MAQELLTADVVAANASGGGGKGNAAKASGGGGKGNAAKASGGGGKGSGGKGSGGKGGDAAQQQQVKKYPKYIYVGQKLKGEHQQMTAGEKEDYFVENLADFLLSLKKGLKADSIKKAIQTELSKLYVNDSDEEMNKFFDNKNVHLKEIIVWNNVAKKFNFITHGQYVADMM